MLHDGAVGACGFCPTPPLYSWMMLFGFEGAPCAHDGISSFASRTSPSRIWNGSICAEPHGSGGASMFNTEL